MNITYPHAKGVFFTVGLAACLPLAKPADAQAFIVAARELRHWPREMMVDLDAKPMAEA